MIFPSSSDISVLFCSAHDLMLNLVPSTLMFTFPADKKKGRLLSSATSIYASPATKICRRLLLNVSGYIILLPEFSHRVIYNGDIFTPSAFDTKKQQCSQVKEWMLGRGIFLDPFLPEKIKGTFNETPCSAKKRFEDFHQDLFDAVLQRSVLERNAINKMKEYWKYYSLLYEDAPAVFDKVKTCNTIDEIFRVFNLIYRNGSFIHSLKA